MLLRKVLRDLKQNAVQFLAIFIMTFFAMFMCSGFDAQYYNDHIQGTQYLTETNYKDMDIQGANFTYSQIDSLEQMDEVKSVNGVLHGTGKTTLDEERLLVISYISGNDISKMMVTDGEEYEPGKRGAWLEKRFADPMGIRVGDTISINSEGKIFQEEVKGLVYYPEYIYYIPNDTYSEPEYGTHGFVVMDICEAPYEDIYFDELIVDLWDVKGQGITLTDQELDFMVHMKEVILDRFDDNKLVVLTKTEDENYKDYIASGDSTASLSAGFTFIFLLVALLGIFTTMTRLTGNQRMQIGTMKALGFSKAKITVHYLSYSMIVAIVASVLGIAVGAHTIGAYLISINEYYYQNPYGGEHITFKSIYMALIAIGMCVCTTYVCTRSILSENAAEILRPAAPKNNSSGFIEKTSLWDKLAFGARWNIRDVDRNKLRTAMSVFGIAVTSALLFAAFGFYETLAGQSRWMFEDLLTANYKILFEDGTGTGVVSDYSKEYSGQMVEYMSVTITSENTQMVRAMLVVDEGNMYRFQNEDLCYFDLPRDGVILTSRLKESLQVKLGDELSWRLPGEDREYHGKIVGFCRQAMDQGIILSKEAWLNVDGEFKPNIVYTNMTVPTSLKDKDGIVAVNDDETMIRSLEASNEIGYTISTIIITIAVTMGIIVLYNLGVLSYIEKIREIATMKVLGFQSLNIRLILMQQNLTITCLGAIIGLPLGRLALYEIVDGFMLDYNDALTDLTFLPYLASVIGTFAVSAIVNVYVTSKVNEINMVEALKGVE